MAVLAPHRLYLGHLLAMLAVGVVVLVLPAPLRELRLMAVVLAGEQPLRELLEQLIQVEVVVAVALLQTVVMVAQVS
jgi:hypothetical protein